MTCAERVNGERLVILGWGRAILMQIAHPMVAAGVADHSTFRDKPASRYTRLHATIQSMLALTFGPPAERQAAIDRINGIHDRVNGTLKASAGRLRAGTRYSAADPALLLWVEATLRDSMPLAYETFVAPLGPDGREAPGAITGLRINSSAARATNRERPVPFRLRTGPSGRRRARRRARVLTARRGWST